MSKDNTDENLQFMIRSSLLLATNETMTDFYLERAVKFLAGNIKATIRASIEKILDDQESAQHMMDDGFDHYAVQVTAIEKEKAKYE